MNIEVTPVEYAAIESMRDLYRAEAGCQIIHDSCLRRQLADAYRIAVDGHVAGYGGVWNKYDPGQIMEFYVTPAYRAEAPILYRELILASGATCAEAQTNMPLMLGMLYDFVAEIKIRNILFEDATATHLECPGAVFRRAVSGDIFGGGDREPPGDWVLDVEGAVVASGGFLCHYNPPYGDIFMEVVESARRHGYGSYLVQELKRVCYEAGRKPAARCNPTNFASRKTLEKAGFLPCGRMLAGNLIPLEQ